MALILIFVGAAATITGTAIMSIPAAIVVAGILVLAAGVDLSRSDEP